MSENWEEIEKVLEETKETSSVFHSLSVTTQTASSVILKWEYQPSVEPSTELVYKLLKLETRDEWKPIAWTRKSTCVVDNLEQNVCYSLRLLVLIEGNDEFKVVDQSDVFKVDISIEQISHNTRLFFHFQCSIQVVPSHNTFIRAIQKSNLNLIKSFLSLVPDFINLTFKSHSALSLAVSNNDMAVAKLLLDYGADVNFGMPEMKRSPLHIAVFYGFLDIADMLIAHKAEIRAKDVLGLNVAHHAIDANNLEAVEYCVETLGIHPETRDNNGLTLLLRAIVARASLDIIRFLLDKKASQAVRDNNKMSILQHVRMINDQNLVDLLCNYKPKSKTDAKQKMKHNVQKLIMSRQMKKDEVDDETGDESVSAFEQSVLFK